MKITEYVLGFIFDPTGQFVVLQKKAKPEWQRNRWNGIGGHIEEGETPGMAMTRECREESNLEIDDWRFVCEFVGPAFTMPVYCAYSSNFRDFEVETGAEELAVFPVGELPQAVIPNLRWLIPMALSFALGERATGFTIQEQHCKGAQ